jgi:hypothetical protein
MSAGYCFCLEPLLTPTRVAEDCVSSVDLSAQIIYFCASQASHVKTRLSRRL